MILSLDDVVSGINTVSSQDERNVAPVHVNYEPVKEAVTVKCPTIELRLYACVMSVYW
jgi:hypothetical protein